MLLDGLNSRQREAVTTTEGPMLIVAGPGTGKTRVLAHRIAYLVRDLGVVPEGVLAVTFTKNAAKSMKKQVTQLIGVRVDDMQVSTFHSVCGQILRSNEGLLGFENSFSFYHQSEYMQVLERAINDLGLDENSFSPGFVMGFISKAKNHLVDCESYASWPGKGPDAENVAGIYRKYQQLLYEASALDYDDTLMMTANMFDAHPQVLSRYQEQFQYIHVDNYQDISYVQCVLIDQLAGRHQNVCVVGDPDQSIYGFRGAGAHNIRSFRDNYPQAPVVVLEQNYRSTKNILDAANAVLAQNQSRQTNSLWTNREKGAQIVLFQGENENEEARFVATEAQNLNNNGVPWSDMAVLYRSKTQQAALERTLKSEGLPYRVIGRGSFYSRSEVKDVLSFLCLIANPADSEALRRIFNTPQRGFSSEAWNLVRAFASQQGISFLEAVGQVEGIVNLAPKDVDAIRKVLADLELLRKQVHRGPAAMIKARLDTGKSGRARAKANNLQELLTRASHFEQLSQPRRFDRLSWDNLPGERRVRAFLDWVTLADEAELEDEGEKITLATIHSATGLEFPVVFMVGMENGVFPTRRALDDPIEMEEERRLFYVSITRARDWIYLVSAKNRLLNGDLAQNPPSRFLQEIPEELRVRAKAPSRATTFEPDGGSSIRQGGSSIRQAGISPSEWVYHGQFGQGYVQKIDGSNAKAAFERVGVKWVPLNSLERFELNSDPRS